MVEENDDDNDGDNTEKKKQDERRKDQQELAQLRAELDQTNKQINDAEAKSAESKKNPPPTDPAQKQQQDAANNQSDRELQLLKDKRQRLQTEIRDLNEKLDSLN